MGSGRSYRVLGPLQVDGGPGVLSIAAGKQRVILAALLLRANRVVPVEQLVEYLWEAGAPADPRAVVQKYVMRLRRVLGPETPIVTDPAGYRIEVAESQLDLDRFWALTRCADAARGHGEPANESACLAQALSLWRAVVPLSNVPSAALQRAEVSELAEVYLGTVERRIDVDLAMDRHVTLVPELGQLVRSHPLRERFWAQLMHAYHGAGRRADALTAYREVARLLAEELGVDPGEELQAARRGILYGPGDAGTDPAALRGGSRPDLWPTPRQLPAATGGVVGREREIAQLVDSLGGSGAAADPHPDGVPVMVVVGAAGVGKTCVAVHAGHRLASTFPDGQLFADLGTHAMATGGSAEVLAQFLHALGLPPAAVPPLVPDRILTYRSLLAGRRVLVVLDDVADVGQVRDLLPGSAGCAVMVTSRDELAGLSVSPGCGRVVLPPLLDADGVGLLHRVLGARGRRPGTAAHRPPSARPV